MLPLGTMHYNSSWTLRVYVMEWSEHPVLGVSTGIFRSKVLDGIIHMGFQNWSQGLTRSNVRVLLGLVVKGSLRSL